MNDYIKREDAIRIIRESPFKRYTTIICYFVGSLNELPSADVRENVRGEWIFPYEDKKYKSCSACGKTFYSIPATSNYCPNCGADMRRCTS